MLRAGFGSNGCRVVGATLVRRARALTSHFVLQKMRRFFVGITTKLEIVGVTGP
jgi:hypothetical protein